MTLVPSDFSELRDLALIPKLPDFNTCFPQPTEDNVNIQPIQSHAYRAPEVLLGCPWTGNVDLWNLGVLMWNMLEGVNLFKRPIANDSQDDAHVHLAEMVSLLGPFLEQVIETEQKFRKAYFRGTITNPQGRECATMNEYWGGPFSSGNGSSNSGIPNTYMKRHWHSVLDQIYRVDLVREGKRMGDMATELAGQEKDGFVDFAGNML
ncbi:hypothetical protein LCI18_013633 [Fusarium solani-melongenae]|uniref:Uncharacterized protein n=1 Tax=Fusarium solani subsp. cucurbitae TaxID=2747967 RepID=A0ACD3ZMY6_FUSSC|nr:hypothetical protein LCI18_013633 [Fusarium solani-melongenae]